MRIYFKLFALLACLLCSTAMQAVSEDELIRLEAEMLKYISTSERDTFHIITERLKEASNEAGNEQLFYKAWSKQALYEATHQNYDRANEIANELANYANGENSVVGKYTALHLKGAILLQKDDYVGAEQAFLKATEYRHKFYPKESAAEDLRELMKIAYIRKDNAKAKEYGRQLLKEPHLEPHHKGRTLYRLSEMAFEENDSAEFNRIYEEMKELKRTHGIRMTNHVTEVNYYIINHYYDEALRLSDWLTADTCAERRALIYHRLGDDAKAYQYMVQYKQIRDSLTHASHNKVVSDLYLRMNNDRLRLQRHALENQNNKLRADIYLIVGLAVVTILLIFIYKRHKTLKLLKDDKQQLIFDNKDAAKALEDLAELSYFENQPELPLTSYVQPNKMCGSLASNVQRRCHKGLTVLYMTELPDEYEIRTNPEALKKMLTHLLDNAVRFCPKGTIKLSCSEKEGNVRFSISDTNPDSENKMQQRFIGMFKNQNNKLRYVGMTYKICESIVRVLKGRMWFDKEYTKGTCLCFEIPQNP